jgi:hypothetical protein
VQHILHKLVLFGAVTGGPDNLCIMPQDGLYMSVHAVSRLSIGRRLLAQYHRSIAVKCPRTSTAALDLGDHTLQTHVEHIPTVIAELLRRNGSLPAKVRRTPALIFVLLHMHHAGVCFDVCTRKRAC